MQNKTKIKYLEPESDSPLHIVNARTNNVPISFVYIKFCSALLIVLINLMAYKFIFNSINIYIVYGSLYTIALYIFRGLDEFNNTNINQFAFSIFVSTITAFVILFALVGLFQLPVFSGIIFIYLIISILIVPVIIFFIFNYAIRRLPEIKIVVLADEKEWGEMIREVVKNSTRRYKIVAFVNDIGKLNSVRSKNNFEIDLYINSFGSEFQEFQKQNHLYGLDNTPITSLSSFSEGFYKKIPVKILEWYEQFYNVIFSEIGPSVKMYIIDFLFSLIIFVLLSPFLLLSILFILILDGYPFFYEQERIGLKGKPFKIFKLRTYKESNGKVVSTRSGKILRMLRFNEIPQIFNVLRGEMSLVGPRPDLPSDFKLCSKEIKFYDCRYNVTPGITGHAQIYYGYVESCDIESFAKRLEYDLYYIKHRSVFFYCTTLLRTVESVILFKGI